MLLVTRGVASQVERRLHDALRAHGHFQGEALAGVLPRRLLSQAFRLTGATAPGVMEALAVSQEVLGHAGSVEVFVRPEAGCRALVLRGPAREPILLLSSRLLEVLSPIELRFVLGRARGHWALGHLDLSPLANALTEDVTWRSASGTDVLQASLWRQAAKVSADRAGLLCARDTEAAASALFKLSSGLAVGAA